MAQRRRPKRVSKPESETASSVTTVREAEAAVAPATLATASVPFVLPWLTVERALYALLMFTAAGLRLGVLGRWPLSSEEAGTALDAWRFLQGAGGSVLGHSPLLFHGNLAIFSLFGSGDAQARFVTALFGTLLVGLPFLLRPVLGRTGALMTALLLATSPTLLYFSRQDVPEVVAATCALALLFGVVRFSQSGERWALYLAAVAFGMGLASGPSFYMHLSIWGLFILVVIAARRQSPTDWPWPDRASVVNFLVISTVTFAVVSTAFLLDWAGLQAATSLPGIWLHTLRPTPSGYPWSFFLSKLALYEPLALLFALVAVFSLLRWRRWETAFAAFWFVGALLLYSTLGASRSPSSMVVIVLPLILLAGGTAGRLIDEVAAHGDWAIEGAYIGLVLPVAVFAVLNLQAYANAGTDRYLGLAVVGLSTPLILLVLVGYWGGLGSAIRAGGLALLLLLSLGRMRNAWNLSLERADNPAEPMIAAATSPDVRQLPVTIANLSNERLRQREAMAVAYHEDLGPVLGWYLRGFDDVRTITGYDASSLPPAVIVPFSNEPPPLGEGYIGQRFRLRQTWSWPELRGSQRVRWLLYRDVTAGYTSTDVILFIQVPQENLSPGL